MASFANAENSFSLFLKRPRKWTQSLKDSVNSKFPDPNNNDEIVTFSIMQLYIYYVVRFCFGSLLIICN